MEFGTAKRQLLGAGRAGTRRPGQERPARRAVAVRTRGAYRPARTRGPERLGRPARRRRRLCAGRARLQAGARKPPAEHTGAARADLGVRPDRPSRRSAGAVAPPHARAGHADGRPARHPGRAGAQPRPPAGRCRRRGRRPAHARRRDARGARQPVGAPRPREHLPQAGHGLRSARRDGRAADVAARHARRAVRQRPARFRNRRFGGRHPVPGAHSRRLAHPRHGRAATAPVGAVAGRPGTGARASGPGRCRARRAGPGRIGAERRHAGRTLGPTGRRLCRDRRRAACAGHEPPAARAFAHAEHRRPAAVRVGAAQDEAGHRTVGRAAPACRRQHDGQPAQRLRQPAHRLRAAPDRRAARSRQPRGRLQRDGPGAGRAPERSAGDGRAGPPVLGGTRRRPGAGSVPAHPAAQPDRPRHAAGRRRQRQRTARARRGRELRDGRAEAGARPVARAGRRRPRLPQRRRKPQGRAVPARGGRSRAAGCLDWLRRAGRHGVADAARQPVRGHDRRCAERGRADGLSAGGRRQSVRAGTLAAGVLSGRGEFGLSGLPCGCIPCRRLSRRLPGCPDGGSTGCAAVGRRARRNIEYQGPHHRRHAHRAQQQGRQQHAAGFGVCGAAGRAAGLHSAGAACRVSAAAGRLSRAGLSAGRVSIGQRGLCAGQYAAAQRAELERTAAHGPRAGELAAVGTAGPGVAARAKLA